jgi:hypothetical protein
MSGNDELEKPGMFYDSGLDTALLKTIDEYSHAVDQALQKRLDQTDWSRTVDMLQRVDEIAKHVMQGTTNLIGPTVADLQQQFDDVEHEYRSEHEKPYWKMYYRRYFGSIPPENVRTLTDLWDIDEIDEGLHEDSVLRAICDRVSIDLARETVEKRLTTAVKRLLQLVKLAASGSPSIATGIFLRHVSRCFIWGFDPECVILCRGAIDTAFRDAIPDDLCANRRQRPPHGYGLQDRIEASCPDVIEKETLQAALRVKCRGDKAVHYDPEACEGVLGTLRDTVDVISKLARKAP